MQISALFGVNTFGFFEIYYVPRCRYFADKGIIFLILCGRLLWTVSNKVKTTQHNIIPICKQKCFSMFNLKSSSTLTTMVKIYPQMISFQSLWLIVWYSLMKVHNTTLQQNSRYNIKVQSQMTKKFLFV